MTPSPSLLDGLASVGLDWDILQRDAQAIILFGSRAAGYDRPDSDWDLLCIGSGPQRLTQRLDILWIPAERATSPDCDWLGSELANHVARFGHALFGELPWTENYGRQELVLARKRRQLDGHVRGLSCVWPRLNAVYRRRQLAQLRRDLQRYDLLSACEPVPPTAVLDCMWHSEADTELRVLELLDRAGVGSFTLERLITARP
jgi:hypothetical protein